MRDNIKGTGQAFEQKGQKLKSEYLENRITDVNFLPSTDQTNNYNIKVHNDFEIFSGADS